MKLFSILTICITLISGHYDTVHKDAEHFINVVTKKETQQPAPPPKPAKVVYLTFDDGPSKYTGQILEILKKENVKGTFFMIGKNMEGNQDIVKRVVAEGHYLGPHSYTHNSRTLYYGNPANVANEMITTKNLIKNVAGVDSFLTRVPYGSKPYMTQKFRDELAKNNLKMWDWTIDSLDWKYVDKNPQKVLSIIKSNLKRNEEIILMHEKKGTVAILPELIQHLKNNGYTIVVYDAKHHIVVNFWKDERL